MKLKSKTLEFGGKDENRNHNKEYLTTWRSEPDRIKKNRSCSQFQWMKLMGRLKLDINETESRTWMKMRYLEIESETNLQQRLRRAMEREETKNWEKVLMERKSIKLPQQSAVEQHQYRHNT